MSMANLDILILHATIHRVMPCNIEIAPVNIIKMFCYIWKVSDGMNDEGKIVNDSNIEYLNHIKENREAFSSLNNPLVLGACIEYVKDQLKLEDIDSDLGNTLKSLGITSTELSMTGVDKILKVVKMADLIDATGWENNKIFSEASKFIEYSNIEEVSIENTDEYLSEIIKDELTYDMRVIKELYDSGYQNFTPDGLLYKRGMISIEGLNDGTGRYALKEMANPTLSKFYSWLNAQTNGAFDLSSYEGHMKPSYENVMGKGVMYYPHYQARNSCGLLGLDSTLDKWLASKNKKRLNNLKDLDTFLYEKLTNTLLDAVKKNVNIDKSEDADLANDVELQRMLLMFRKAFTTGVVISENKKNVITKVKICTGDDSVNLLTKELFEAAIRDNRIFSKATEITQYSLKDDVLTVTFMMDSEKYNNFPLFAYQALDAIKRNGKPDWKNVIVGRTEKDQIFKLNLADNKNRVISIIAGARSGKGVMTMNFLANAYALGYPVFYLDFKPDMALTFHNLARSKKYTPPGSTELVERDTFAFDGLHSTVGLSRDYQLLTWMNKLDPDVLDAIDNNGIGRDELVLFTSYIKGVQLITDLIKLRAQVLNHTDNGFTLDELGGERVVFVLDEIEKFCIQAVKFLEGKDSYFSKAQDYIKNTRKDIKDIKSFAPYNWFDDYRIWVNSVFSSLRSLDKAELGLSKSNIFILAQSTNIDSTWGKYVGANIAPMIKIGLTCCGNGSTSGEGSTKYGSGKCCESWRNQLPKRYFIIQKEGGDVISDDTCELVKGYFLLNEVYEPDGVTTSRFVNDMFDNLGPQAESVRAQITDSNGRLNEAIGFEGYMKALTGASIDETLQKSYDVMQLISGKMYGKPNLLDFMYDITNNKAHNNVIEYLNERENEEKSKSATSSDLLDKLKNGEATSQDINTIKNDIGNESSAESSSGVNVDSLFDEDELKDEKKPSLNFNFGNLPFIKKSDIAESILSKMQSPSLEKPKVEFTETDEPKKEPNDYTDEPIDDFDDDIIIDGFDNSNSIPFILKGEYKPTILNKDTGGNRDEQKEEGERRESEWGDEGEHSGVLSGHDIRGSRVLSRSSVGRNREFDRLNLEKESGIPKSDENIPYGESNIDFSKSKVLNIDAERQKRGMDSFNNLDDNLRKLDKDTEKYNDIGRRRESVQENAKRIINDIATNGRVTETFRSEDYETAINMMLHNGGSNFSNSRGKQRRTLVDSFNNVKAGIIGLDSNNSADASNLGFMGNNKVVDMMAKSRFGAQMFRKEVCKNIIRQILNRGTRNQVAKLTFKEEQLLVNNTYIYLNGIVGEGTGRNLSDAIIFGMFAKEFNRINSIYLDEPFIESFSIEYNLNPTDAVAITQKIFNLFPLLNEVNLCDNSIRKVDLLDANRRQREAEKQERISRKLQEKRSAEQFDAELGTMTNNRGAQDDLMSRAWNASKKKTGNYWSGAERAALQDRKLGETLLYGSFAVVATGVSLVTGVGNLLTMPFRRNR